MGGAVDGVGAMAVQPASSSRERMAAWELTTMAAVPAAMVALTRLNVFNALAAAGDGAMLTPAKLAELALPGRRIDITNLTRLLRMMAAKKILREVAITDAQSGDGAVSERRFGLEPIGRFMADDVDRGSFAHLLDLVQAPEILVASDHLHQTVLDPSVQPFVKAHGVPHWTYNEQRLDRSQVMNKAMTAFAKANIPGLLDAYSHGFDNVRVLVDVGGGLGTVLELIIARYPHLKGINFDLPHVVADAAPVPGVEHVGGSMFESVPSGGDAIIMKSILHSWDDESCLTILRNCHRALPAGGKVIILDCVLPEVIDYGVDVVAFQSDIHMLACGLPGGRERTERQQCELGYAAGFKEAEVMCKVGIIAVTELRKSA